MYIYKKKDWPHFVWNQERISQLLISLRYQQGCLIGGMESIGFSMREESFLQTLTQDVVKSSEIEGEFFDQDVVRSSVARHLGMKVVNLDVVDRNIEGMVTMLLDATQKFNQPLTKQRLLQWHSLLFPSERKSFTKLRVGAWRTTSVQVISGNMGKEKVHFEGPPAKSVQKEMAVFLHWFNHNQGLDLVIKAAIAHLWFITIHPFDDGNGRIGRAIADLMLARSENNSHRFYSLSAQIQKERKGYYSILESSQKGDLDITAWIEWFFDCLSRAIENAQSTLERIKYKAKFWESCAGLTLNERQHKVINLLLNVFEGKLTSSKWAKLTKCSQDTAYRDILDLVSKGILIKGPEGGRNTSYLLYAEKK